MFPGLFLYIYVLIGFCTLYFDVSKRPQKVYDRTFNVLYVFLALLVAFRYKVGPDTFRYMLRFSETPILTELSFSDFDLSRFQPMYVLIYSLSKTIYNDFLVVQIFQASLFYHSFYLLLKILDLKKFYILFFFFGSNYLAELSGLRECLGLSFCMYALLFYMNNKWVQFYVLVVTGMLCHSGMFVFLALPLMKLFRTMSITNIFIMAFGLLLMGPAFKYLQLFSVLVGEEASILSYELEDGQLRYSTFVFIILKLVVVIYFFFVRKRWYDGYQRDFVYLGIFYIFLGFYSEALPILYRFTAHFAIFYFFIIQETFRHSKKNVLMITAMFILFSYTPIARFVNDMRTQPSEYNYCSVFSSEHEKIIMSKYSSGF